MSNDEKNGLTGVSGTGPHKVVVRSELIAAFDRLVKPLDQILEQMKLHAGRQKSLVTLSIAIIGTMILAIAFQVRLLMRLSEIEQRISEINGVANATNAKVTSTEKKIDEVKSAASSSSPLAH